MGQRVLLYALRSGGLAFLVAGLVIFGVWRLGKEVLENQPDLWSLYDLGFLFRLGVTWAVAGAIVPILLWAIRPALKLPAPGHRLRPPIGGVTSLLPGFLALLALLAVVSGRPVLTWWRESLALVESLELWQPVWRGFEQELLGSLPMVGLFFVPVVASAAIVSFAAGAATTVAFRREGSWFVRVYAAWLVAHAALVLAVIYAAAALGSMSEPWLELLDSVSAADLEIATELRVWIPGKAALTATVAKRLIWISLMAVAWLPLLFFAVKARPDPSRRRL